MKKLFVYMAFAAILGGGAVTAQQQDITLEDIWTKRTFAPQGIGSLRSMADGEHYCTMNFNGIAKYSYATGEKVADVCLFSGPNADRKIKNKAAALPRMESYTFSQDETKILFSSGFEPIYRHSGVSNYWLYNVGGNDFIKLTRNGKQRLTTLSPDGTKVAFVRDNNLYWMDLETLEEHQITTDGKINEIINGTTDWVYEEEFAITQGFQWSPDSKKIAYMRFDESKVREYNMQTWGALYPEDYRYKYPKAGEDNSVVTMGIYNLENPKAYAPAIAYVNADNRKYWEYIPRFQWADANTLAVMRMNRLQNHMQILAIGTNDGDNKVNTLYEEQCGTYVEVPDTWQFITVGKGKKAQQQMLITSERDGYRHIYLYNMDGKLAKQVTTGGYEVCEVVGVDAANQRLYYTSREDGAINKSLFVIGFDGKKKQCLNYNQKDFALNNIYNLVDGAAFNILPNGLV